MDKNQITEEFIERMVDKVVSEIKRKLDELDVSLDFIVKQIYTSRFGITGFHTTVYILEDSITRVWSGL